MTLRLLTLRALLLVLFASAPLACSNARPKAPATVADVRASIAAMHIPACDAYVSALETECFGAPGHAFPAGVAQLIGDRVAAWQDDLDEKGGGARVARACASSLESVHTFHCVVR